MLVHVSKGELAGLQALAKSHGKSLTTNPDTGLPEAFSLKKLLPMAAGAALMATGVGAPMAAMMVGGGMFAATGSLEKGLMAGLGAYGGAGLGGMAGLGAEAGTQAMAGQVGEAAMTPGVTEAVATPVETIQAGGSAMPATQQYAGAYQPTSFSASPANLATEMNAYSPTQTNFGAFGEAPGTVSQVQPNQYGAFGEAPPTSTTGSVTNAAQQNAAASYGNQAVGQTSRPSFMDNVMADKMGAAKYGLAAATPAMMERPDYNPPEIKGDSDMGQRYGFASGYDPSIPGRTANPSYTQISDEEAKKRYGFADGGEIQYPTGEPVMRMADGGPAASSGYGAYTAQDANVAARGLGTGIDYSGYNTAPNQGIMAALSKGNPNQNIVDLYKAVDAKKAADEAKAAADAAQGEISSSFFGSYAQGGGISTLGGYSDGGRLLKGPGDGMSDNIPAKIGAKQPARLADGEFVVPADVVSHLGNGSTDAGAKQLYKMMDKIRTARTGRKAQGKQVNPNKFMPA
jgi:hypothetical protein